MAADANAGFALSDWAGLLETGVLVIDRNACLVAANAAATEALAAGLSRLQAESLDRHPALPGELRDSIVASLGDGRSRRLHDCDLAGGRYDVTLHPPPDGGLVIELQDQLEAVRRLEEQHRDVRRAMFDALRRNLGHEIRNPLGGIRGAAQMLSAEVASPDLAEMARLIMREVDRVDDLLARLGETALETGPVDLHLLLGEVIDLLDAEHAGELRWKADLDPSIPNLSGDGGALRQVLINLCRNAVQAGATTVRLGTRIVHGTPLLTPEPVTAVCVEISDDGEGVPERLRPLLFLPLVTGRRDGTGLGLALSQQIAAAHGGLLAYEPLPRGSRFTLQLPLRPPAADPGD